MSDKYITLENKTAAQLFRKDSRGYTFIENFINDEFLEQFDFEDNFRIGINQDEIMKTLNSIVAGEKGSSLSNKVINFINFLINVTNMVVQKIGVTYDLDAFIREGVPNEILESSQKLNYDNIFENSSKIDELYAELTEHFYQRGTHLGSMVKSGARGNKYSIGTSFLHYGYRIDSDNLVSKKFTESSLFDGFVDDADFYNSALSSRNSLIQTVDAIPSSGYIYRKLSQLLVDVKLQKEFCGNTSKLLSVNIDEETFKKYKGRNIFLDGEIVSINNYNKEELLGTNVAVFTPVHCKAKGKNLCSVCLGDHVNGLDGFGSIGIFSAMMFCADITNSLLATKHLQYVVIDDIPDEFKEILVYDFDNEGFFLQRDITEVEFNKINETYEPPFTKFSLESNLKKGEMIFSVKNTDDNFVKNTAVNSIMSELKNILECAQGYKDWSDVDEFCRHFTKFGEDAGFRMNRLHYEIFMSIMFRLRSDPNSLVRNSKEGEEGVVLGLTSSLLNKNSVFDLLLFERIKGTINNFRNIRDDISEKSELEKFFLGEK